MAPFVTCLEHSIQLFTFSIGLPGISHNFIAAYPRATLNTAEPRAYVFVLKPWSLRYASLLFSTTLNFRGSSVQARVSDFLPTQVLDQWIEDKWLADSCQSQPVNNISDLWLNHLCYTGMFYLKLTRDCAKLMLQNMTHWLLSTYKASTNQYPLAPYLHLQVHPPLNYHRQYQIVLFSV